MENKFKKLKLVTHSESFHTDDIFAFATLSLVLEKAGQDFEVLRTRDEEEIKNADCVFDVGGIYDEATNRFDHHQPGGAGKRESGVEYASFGLVWKKFGIELTGSAKAAEMIDKKLCVPVDAWDNGFALAVNKYPGISQYLIQHVFFSMEPTWKESNINIDDMFLKSVGIARQVLEREIIFAAHAVEAEEKVVEVYKKTEDKRILIIEKNYPFQYALQEFPEPLYVVYPRKANSWWGVKAVSKDPKTFLNRKDFPISWGGARDGELQKLTGVSDAVFCHKGLYMCVAKSKEGAVKLAQIAVES